MAYAVAEIETDADAERVRAAEANWWRGVIDNLKRVQFEKRHEADFIALASTRMTATGAVPNISERARIKDLAWKYRRQLPKPVAPKLPPRDPIVSEMERQNGC